MPRSQAQIRKPTSFELQTRRLGPLPLVNHFVKRLRIESLLERFVPTTDRRCLLPHAKGLGVLLRSIIVEREAIYRQQETVQTFATGMFGLEPEEIAGLNDDRVGRALDELFDADRGSLLTQVVVTMGRRFGVRFEELHNDSTTIRLAGQYRSATGRCLRGKRAPWITYGYSKDHRPDIKQLLFILTTSADGGVSVQFRCQDGNTSDSTTHIDTWKALCQVAGRTDFLYVADSKLCSEDNMDYIARHKGRFVTVMPRSRREDQRFRKWIQTNEPAWDLVWDRPNPRRKYGPRDRWWVFRDTLPSREAWPVIWVFSSLLALHTEHTRAERLARAREELAELKQKLAGPRSRIRKAAEIDARVEKILRPARLRRYLKVRRTVRFEERFRQRTRGRPGPNTSYRRIIRRHWDIEWETDEAAIAYDRKSDGMYPLLTNDRSLTPAQVLQAHKRQPTIEKRFEQTKTVFEVAPIFLKNEGRVEALFCLYFLALLVQALIERELRLAMKRERIAELPLYPEQRLCRKPCSAQILRLFSPAEGQVLRQNGSTIQTFDPQLTDLQRQILRLLRVPTRAYQLPR